ncbi:tRNA 2-selenouridine(34) synthase MnmH [Malonomonas rubra]|uniref:tRNA 2-selenouridine(34) synthase MnmH n=1 Tax=Malonomonas rubra TaxID=57040 RepID=UPI0026F15371|nr:tRNA 2-selenouridine(34) synthase MnmH [Malonomonas rubra]
MIQATIELEKALQLRREGALLVDVRTPAEFAEATIPGAINVPIFSNEERVEVGTLYKQRGKGRARKFGIELVAPKIPALLEQVEEVRRGHRGPVIVFCWRGGMRSLAMTSFMNLAGIHARQLIGGHKAFRTLVCSYFEKQQWPPIYVLRGLTGVGKTQVLHRLAEQGFPVIDLEGLANHRGSAFGALGLEPQPGQKRFEALLWDRLQQLESSAYLVTEGESLHIGRLLVPKRFHQAMQEQTSLWLKASLNFRTRIILEDYPAIDRLREQFEQPICALKERLGNKVIKQLLDLLHAGEWEELVYELMVHYYDPLYMHTLPEKRIEIELEPFDAGVKRVARSLAELAEQEILPSP